MLVCLCHPTSDRDVDAVIDDGARTVPAVLSALEAAGVTVTSVTVARPSLDDVYLRLTGRTFSEAEAEQERDEPQQGGGSK